MASRYVTEFWKKFKNIKLDLEKTKDRFQSYEEYVSEFDKYKKFVSDLYYAIYFGFCSSSMIGKYRLHMDGIKLLGRHADEDDSFESKCDFEDMDRNDYFLLLIYYVIHDYKSFKAHYYSFFFEHIRKLRAIIHTFCTGNKHPELPNIFSPLPKLKFSLGTSSSVRKRFQTVILPDLENLIARCGNLECLQELCPTKQSKTKEEKIQSHITSEVEGKFIPSIAHNKFSEKWKELAENSQNMYMASADEANEFFDKYLKFSRFSDFKDMANDVEKCWLNTFVYSTFIRSSCTKAGPYHCLWRLLYTPQGHKRVARLEELPIDIDEESGKKISNNNWRIIWNFFFPSWNGNRWKNILDSAENISQKLKKHKLPTAVEASNIMKTFNNTGVADLANKFVNDYSDLVEYIISN